MRTLIVIDTLNHVGGAQKQQVLFAEQIKNQDISLTFVCLKKEKPIMPLRDRLIEQNIPVYFFPTRNILDPIPVMKIFQLIRNENIDIVQTHLIYANVLGIVAAWLAGVPGIGSLRNTKQSQRRWLGLRKPLETFTLRYLAKKVTAVGYNTANIHQKRLGKQKIIPILNAVPPTKKITQEQVSALRSELLFEGTDNLLIAVGRLKKQKGFDDLLKAFAILLTNHPNTSLVIAGDGILHKDLNHQIISLGLENNARLLGARNDIPALLSASDIFISSSLWEGMSNAILEAMAAGLPVIATPVGETPTMVIEGAGILTPPNNPKLLAESIAQLISNPAQREEIGKAAAEHVARQHAPQATANTLIQLYQSVINSNNSDSSK